jgi:hypothetical protein
MITLGEELERLNWTEQTYDEFQEGAHCLPPLIRLGCSNGPGAILCSEPSGERICAVTGKLDYSYTAWFVVEDPSVDNFGMFTDEGREIGEDNRHSRYYVHNEDLTLHEFKALCDQIMPGVGVCGMGWGSEYVNADGSLRADLKFPIRIYGK